MKELSPAGIALIVLSTVLIIASGLLADRSGPLVGIVRGLTVFLIFILLPALVLWRGAKEAGGRGLLVALVMISPLTVFVVMYDRALWPVLALWAASALGLLVWYEIENLYVKFKRLYDRFKAFLRKDDGP